MPSSRQRMIEVQLLGMVCRKRTEAEEIEKRERGAGKTAVSRLLFVMSGCGIGLPVCWGRSGRKWYSWLW